MSCSLFLRSICVCVMFTFPVVSALCLVSLSSLLCQFHMYNVFIVILLFYSYLYFLNYLSLSCFICMCMLQRCYLDVLFSMCYYNLNVLCVYVMFVSALCLVSLRSRLIAHYEYYILLFIIFTNVFIICYDLLSLDLLLLRI